MGGGVKNLEKKWKLWCNCSSTFVRGEELCIQNIFIVKFTYKFTKNNLRHNAGD